MLLKNWYLLGVNKFQATPIKQDLGTSESFFSKFATSMDLYRSRPSGLKITSSSTIFSTDFVIRLNAS